MIICCHGYRTGLEELVSSEEEDDDDDDGSPGSSRGAAVTMMIQRDKVEAGSSSRYFGHTCPLVRGWLQDRVLLNPS